MTIKEFFLLKCLLFNENKMIPPTKCWAFYEKNDNWNKAKMINFSHSAKIRCLQKMQNLHIIGKAI